MTAMNGSSRPESMTSRPSRRTAPGASPLSRYPLAAALAVCFAAAGCSVTPHATWRPFELAACEPSAAANSYLTGGTDRKDSDIALGELTSRFVAGADEQAAFALAERSYAAAQRHESAEREACVDQYFLAAFYSWECLFSSSTSPPNTALPQGQSVRCAAIYNASVAKLVETGQRFHRFQPPAALRLNVPGGPSRVALEYHGLEWPPDQIERWLTVGQYEADELTRRYCRRGVGAPLVGLRRRAHGQPGERFLPERLPLAATAVLYPDAQAREAVSELPLPGGERAGVRGDLPTNELAGGNAPRRPTATLHFYNPTEISTVAMGGRSVNLAADYSAPWALTLVDPDRSRVEYGGFFRPEETADASGLYMLERYQPGKIPVVMVHGLISGPWTWIDVVNELRAEPELRERYQLWVYRYPTGGPLLHAAARLRCELRAAREAVDPAHADPALDRMVLLGYSLGGLISKLQVSYSGEGLWGHYATRPLDSLRLADGDRRLLRHWFYFEPEPYIARVVCLATPHRGTRTRNQYVGRFAANFVRFPLASDMAERIVKCNPGAFRVSADKLLATSADLLAEDDLLSAGIREMPMRQGVKLHTVIGAGQELWGGEDSDGVVTVASARLDGAASECLVPAEHGVVHRHPQSIAEIKRVLREHLR
jgi:hypothetical protein